MVIYTNVTSRLINQRRFPIKQLQEGLFIQVKNDCLFIIVTGY